jgi:RimJ/RimL family protein N-acetyltransferase
MTRTPLENAHVRLEPLMTGHVDALTAAATADRRTFDLAPVPRDRAEMVGYVEAALADEQANRALPYAIVDKARGRVVGSIRLMSLEWWTWRPGPIQVAGEPRRAEAGDPPDVAELGHGWLEPASQRTAVFTATSLLLLGYAFDDWRVHRLVLKTDERNARSRAAIERLGGRFEGILRAHLPAADGVLRNTATYALLPHEWPATRKRLEGALGSPLYSR